MTFALDDRSRPRTPLLIVPGFQNSGPRHWQTLWQQCYPGAIRFDPASWTHPTLEDWLRALDRAAAACPTPPIVIAHSLGSTMFAAWASQPMPRTAIRGAFLVAPADPLGSNFPVEASTFRAAPERPLAVPAIVIASSNDPYCSLDRARKFASDLGAGFVSAGALGHINADSGVTTWQQGQDLLQSFAAGLAVRT